ncbi:hypothetical protein MPSYJ_22980 [Mycolicibacterium psychrotolerans]|uniref:Uncharacterized protein n=1 Tax=Mycolicibacterium psychrotolerans TaxID=216929 RepID=A0A7I7MAH5_9MYCO|nr:hypothetical protein MPSYJ_22980 [Mycolicibacterium psychrotolerans]
MSSQGESQSHPLTDSRRRELAAEWRKKILVAMDDDGYVVAGWGYNQSAPTITAYNDRLRVNPDPLSALSDLLDTE